MYKADMEEAEEYLDAYLERAEEFAKLNIDFKLQYMLNEYPKHKKDSEKKWLFYTTLRDRVDDIINTMNESPTQFKDHLHLMTSIRGTKN